MSSVAATAASSTITNQSQYNTQYTQFLQMLTTELQNQDPTSPMDTNQFTGQLVAFSQLEQQLQTNQSLQTMIANQQSSAAASSLGMLGHTVMAAGNAFELSGTGTSTINYSLPSAAASATMTVTDSSGAVVDTYQLPPADQVSGLNTIAYDGTQDGGSALPAGTYTYAISAADASGNAITATTYTSGVVTGIDSTSGTTILDLGQLQVDASAVAGIST